MNRLEATRVVVKLAGEAPIVAAERARKPSTRHRNRWLGNSGF